MPDHAEGRPDSASPSPAPEQVTVLAQYVANPGREAAARDALLRNVERTRAEAGNVRYDVHQLKNSPAAYYVLHS